MGPAPHRASLILVLQALPTPPDVGSLEIETLGAGVQADLFVVRARDRSPLWQSHDELVVKLYKPTDSNVHEVARDEFESLDRLNARLDGRVINGWRIRTPAPLYHSERPSGLVMTMVPGRSLNAHIRAGGAVIRGDLDRLAGAIGAALVHYWEHEARIYGDIDFNNILCEPAAGVLSFVDPGMPEQSYLCDGVDRRWYPASRDLAYLMFDVATSERLWFGRPTARKRQRELAERVVHACLAEIGSAPAKALLNEVDACARAHLGRIKASWSLAGTWRRLLRRMAARTIDQTIRRLRADSETRCVCPADGLTLRPEGGWAP
jgi:hypothetical protein